MRAKAQAQIAAPLWLREERLPARHADAALDGLAAKIGLVKALRQRHPEAETAGRVDVCALRQVAIQRRQQCVAPFAVERTHLLEMRRKMAAPQVERQRSLQERRTDQVTALLSGGQRGEPL